MSNFPIVGVDALKSAIPEGMGVFLETSVQVERFFSTEARRWAVEGAASSRPVYTSSTVFREFHGAMLSAFQHIADTLRDVSTGTLVRLSEVGRYVAESPGLYGERRAKRIVYVLSHLQDLLSDQEMHHPTDVADLCVAEIARFRRQRFFRVGLPGARQDVRTSGGYVDHVQCSVAAHPLDPSKRDAKRMSCDQRTRKCEVRGVLGSAVGCIEALPEEWHRRRPSNSVVAQRVASWPDDAFTGDRAVGQSACWPLGDVVIAHECPANTVLMTKDRDFLYIVPEAGRLRVLLVQ